MEVKVLESIRDSLSRRGSMLAKSQERQALPGDGIESRALTLQSREWFVVDTTVPTNAADGDDGVVSEDPCPTNHSRQSVGWLVGLCNSTRGPLNLSMLLAGVKAP